jgi:hypothetical protein
VEVERVPEAESHLYIHHAGTYWIEVLVFDNSGYADLISAYVVATP